MKKKIIIVSVIAVVGAASFIPVTQEQTVQLKAPFFDVYQHLARADNWKKWRSDLRAAWLADTSKVTDTKDAGGFSIRHGDTNLHVSASDGNFLQVDERDGGKNYHYGYAVLPGKLPNQCSVMAIEKPTLISFLLGKLGGKASGHTRIMDFKNFIETPDLYYGFAIRKIKATDTCIVVLRKLVSAKDQFNEAARMLNTLKQYFSRTGLVQTQPLIAQFLSSGKDSVQVNIGLPINKKLSPGKPFDYMSMPAVDNLYSVIFRGRFIERKKAYTAVYQFYKDKGLQLPLLPIDIYLDNRLPVSDSSKVNIQILFATY